MLIICGILTLIKEMSFHTGLLVSLGISLLHYQDTAKFSRIISGDAGFSLFSIYAAVFLRNFVNLFVIGRTEIPQVAVCQFIHGGEDSFFVTMARVILAEIFVMDIVLVIKLIVSFCCLLVTSIIMAFSRYIHYQSYLLV